MAFMSVNMVMLNRFTRRFAGMTVIPSLICPYILQGNCLFKSAGVMGKGKHQPYAHPPS
jgi:hypothetical protein